MTAVTFDTHAAIERLTKASISAEHAKAMVETFRDAQSQLELATKADLQLFEVKLSADLKVFHAGIEKSMEAMEMRIVKWVGASFLATVTSLFSVLFTR